MTKLQKALGADLASIAELLRSKGRGKDTVLAHITPKEAALLKKRGGRGSKNPDTGLLEFDDTYDQYMPPADTSSNTFTPAPTESSNTFQVQAPTTDTSVSAPQQTSVTPNNQTISDTQASQDASYGQSFPSGSVPQGQQLPNGDTAYAPTQLTPAQLNQTAAGESPYPSKPNDPSWLDKAGKAVTDPGNLAKMALAGGLGLFI